jgi:large subunit ribosomal protein L21
MFAVIETGGKQYKVRVGDEIKVEKLAGAPKGEVTFEKVLMMSKDGDVKVGTPYLDGVSVKGTITVQDKDKKVIVFKHKPRKGVNRKRGHRQPFTAVKVTDIVG